MYKSEKQLLKEKLSCEQNIALTEIEIEKLFSLFRNEVYMKRPYSFNINTHEQIISLFTIGNKKYIVIWERALNQDLHQSKYPNQPFLMTMDNLLTHIEWDNCYKYSLRKQNS